MFDEIQKDVLVTLNQRKRPREDKLISKIDRKLPKKRKLNWKWDFNVINDDHKQANDVLPGLQQPTIIKIRECCGSDLKTCLDHLTNHHIQDQKFLAQINLQPFYQYEFDQVRVALGNLIETVAPVIGAGIPSVQDLKLYLHRCFIELKPQLTLATSFDDVMEIVEDKCTVVNICCLEAIISHYDITVAELHIKVFKKTVDDFCEKLKAEVCSSHSSISTLSSHCFNFETLEFVVEWNVENCILDDIRGLLLKAFKDIAKNVRVTTMKEDNLMRPFIIPFTSPNTAEFLLMSTDENADLIIRREMEIIKLMVGFDNLLDVFDTDEIKTFEQVQTNEMDITLALKLQQTKIEAMVRKIQDLKNKIGERENELRILKEMTFKMFIGKD